MVQRDDLPALKPLVPGAEIAGYVIERQIGAGGMSVVYGAVQPRIGKRVAIKVLSRTFDDPSAKDRFEQEARVVNAIGHQNIVDVFHFGELPDGRSFFVMEWLEGETVGARLKRGPIPLRLTVAILEEICDALEAAHEQGVVHRDLKADNVFLATMRKGRAVKLLDFGLAKLVEQGEAAASVHNTGVGILVGTPSYMSPEQARAREVDGRTDIYSLGCLAFLMLTRQLPFRADNPLDLLNLQLDAPPPSAASIVANIPRALSDLVKQMMAKAPEDRPSLARIRQVLHQVRETKGTGSPLRDGRREIWMVVVGSVLVAAAITAVIITVRHIREPAPTTANQQTPSTAGSALETSVVVPDAMTAPPRSPEVEPREIEMEPQVAGKQPNRPAPSKTPTQPVPPATTTTTEPAPTPTMTDTGDVRFPGILVVSIDVAAEIWIDGAVRATNSRGGRFELRPGKHAIRIVTPRGQVVEREVEIGTAMTTDMKISIPALVTPTVDAGAPVEEPKAEGSAGPPPS